jgi:Ca2+-transporting ATPase
MGHALSARSELPLIQLPLFGNPWLLLSIVATILLQFALIYVRPLNSFFETYWLSLTELGLCLGFSMLLFIYLESRKLLRRFHHSVI